MIYLNALLINYLSVFMLSLGVLAAMAYAQEPALVMTSSLSLTALVVVFWAAKKIRLLRLAIAPLTVILMASLYYLAPSIAITAAVAGLLGLIGFFWYKGGRGK